MAESSNRPLRVFLCHASGDKPKVRELYRRLVADDVDAWLDEENLLPGQDWRIEIPTAVRNSDVVIVCLSKDSVTKEGYIQKEIRIALDVAEEKPEGTIFIIPVCLDECDVPDRISHWQWINLYSDPKELDEQKYKKLLSALKLRSTQIGATFSRNKHQQNTHQFVPNDLAIMPPRAWLYPTPKNVLNIPKQYSVAHGAIEYYAARIEEILKRFGVPANVVEINLGPRFLQFGIEPSYKSDQFGRVKVRISEFESLTDDIAFALGMKHVYIQTSIPERNFLIGINIPNEILREVSLREILENQESKKQFSQLGFVLGRNEMGAIFVDLTLLPNVLIAGAPRSGKSTFIDAIVSYLLLQNSPNDLQMIFVDTRRIEFSIYQDIPHLLSPIMTTANEIEAAFEWLIQEMEERVKLFARLNRKNINEYNKIADFKEKLPFIVMVISDLSDLMNDNFQGVENGIVRLTRTAQISGIHLIVSTQNPSEDVITNKIKSNIINRVAFATSTEIESKVIIDHTGAEKLLGQGDMLYRNISSTFLARVQGVFITQDEIAKLINFWQVQVT